MTKTLVGEIYKLEYKYHDPLEDEFIVVEELNNVVALMNNRTNSIHWESKHMLHREYRLKKGTNK